MAIEQRPANCSYALDHRLVITSVGAGWDEFAIDNNAPELVSPAPVGRPLMSYVTDVTTVHLYEQIFQRAARAKRAITFPIRCDAPNLRRFLDVTITPDSAGGFLVSTALVRAEARDAIVLFGTDVPNYEGTLMMCGWCKRVDLKGKWVDVEQAVASLRMFEWHRQPQLSHGMCEVCHRSMVALLDDYRKPRAH